MKTYSHIIWDIFIIAISIVFAVFFGLSGAIENFLNLSSNWAFLNSFIAGFFFTSVFTTAPATVVLGELAQTNSIIWIALLGGLGAMCGDLIIFRFMRDRLDKDIRNLAVKSNEFMRAVFKLKLFRWVTFMVGIFVLASPLPDELGLMLLGFSRPRTSKMAKISFVFNALGIAVIGLIARTL